LINCQQCVALLMEYLAGELDAEQCEHFRKHLEKCPPCVIYVETYHITIKLTRQLPRADLPPDVAERLRAALGKSLD
jgi:anti-sigma factor RsiW